MKQYICILLTVSLLSGSVLAGGSIFGGHKARTSNPEGVSSIGLHICGSLNCPDVILQTGDCFTVPNASVRYGVCVCDDGYYGEGGTCKPCPTGTYSDGVGGCTACPDGTYRDSERRRCVACPEEPYCPLDNECCELEGPLDVCGRKTPVLGFKDEWGECHSCSERDTVIALESECNRCVDEKGVKIRKIFDYTYVYGGGPKALCGLIDCGDENFHAYNGTCVPCDYESSIIINPTDNDCSKCGKSRKVYGAYFKPWGNPLDYTSCSKASCDDGEYLDYDVYGAECRTCDHFAPLYGPGELHEVSSLDECGTACGGGIDIVPAIVSDGYWEDGTYHRIRRYFCASPCEDGYFMSNTEEIAPDGRFLADYPFCLPCSGERYEDEIFDGMNIFTSESECNRCGSLRNYQKVAGVGVCIIADCGNGRIYDYDRYACYSCTEEYIYTTSDQSEKCTAWGYPRFYVNEYFVSYLCETDYEYATEEECAQCGSQYTYNIGTGKCSKVS